MRIEPPKDIIKMANINMINGNVEGRRHHPSPMNRRKGVPLLKSRLENYSRNVKKTSYVRIILAFCLVTTLSTNSLSESTPQDNFERLNDTKLLDVMIIDSSCLESQDICHASRAKNLIEYYGADWCEPCEQVESSLELLDYEENVLIQHHPSVMDQSYLNHSNFRFEDKLRLIFIPSIVLNLNGLLTGSSQSMEIGNILSNSTANFSGVKSLKMTNHTLTWESEFEIDLTIWKTESVTHEFDNRTLPYLATDLLEVNYSNLEVNLSAWLSNWSGRLVFTLEQPGITELNPLSKKPTGNLNLYDGQDQENSVLRADGTPKLAILVFVISLITLLPALLMFSKLRRKNISEADE